MSGKGLPDAWDDDYEAVADSKTSTGPLPVSTPTRAERKAQHVAANKALWESADNPEAHTPFFIRAKDDVPLKSQAKPQVQVLARKPKPPEANKPGPRLVRRGDNSINSVASNSCNMNGAAQEEEELDSEDEARLEEERKLKERQERAKVEREEKLRKYEETRARIFNETNGSQDKGNSKGSPVSSSQNNRRRGGGRGGRGGSGSNSRPSSSAGQSPARGAAATQKQLYDPEGGPNSGPSSFQRSLVQPQDSQIIRQPRGPDGSGRGGFGFASRGDKGNVT